MRVVVLVPRREDGARRDQLWQYVQSRWLTEHPEWPIYTGHHDEGPFNRSAAINEAAATVGDWDVAVIADSDSFVGASQIDEAVRRATASGQITFAFDRFCYLSRTMSDLVMDGYQGMWEPGVEWSLPGTCSSMVVVTRSLWDQARGFDEGFVGWGGEDIGFSHACQTFGNGLQRVPGPVWHLHHPTAVHADHDTWVPRCERYAQAAYDKAAMTDLLDELGVGRVSV